MSRLISRPITNDDLVNKPFHYTSDGIDTLDFIRCKKLDYLAGNVIKYIVRHKIKENPLQDLQKARFYLNRMIEEEEDATK